jgi:hypothetical protein
MSDDEGLVNNITSECQTEVIKKISFYTSNNTSGINITLHYILNNRPASWSSVQSFRLLIMRFRVRFPVLPWGLFLEGEDPHVDHGMGSLVELMFKAPPGTSYSYITIHPIGTT